MNIRNFDELAKKFTGPFVSSKPLNKKLATLINIGQQSHESLRDYVTRFTNESFPVQDLNDQVTKATFINGLLPDKLTSQFHEKCLETLDEL